MTDDTRDVLELVIAEYRHAPNPVFVRAIHGALAAKGLVIVPLEPTEAMLKVGAVALNNCMHCPAVLGHPVPSIYRAMIDTP